MNKKIIYIFIFISCVSFSVRAQDNKDELLINAKKLAFAGKFVEAKEIYEKIITLYPNCDACYFELANALISTSDYTAAKENAEKAHNLDPDNPWFTLLYARLCYDSREFGKAQSLFRHILKYHGDKQDVWLNLASSYYERGFFPEALGVLDSMVMRFGDNDDIAYHKFNIFVNTGDYHKAIKEVESLVNSYPADHRFMTLLADTYLEIENDSAALVAYERAVNINESFAPALIGRAELYRKKGQFPQYFKSLQKYMANRGVSVDEKIEYMGLILNIPTFANYFKRDIDTLFAVLTAIHPASMNLKSLQAYYFVGTERPELAISLLNMVTSMDPGNKVAWKGLLSLEYSLMMSAQLEESATKAMLSDPKYPDFYMYLALAFWQRDKIKPAIQTLETGLKKADKDSVYISAAYSLLGDLYHSLNKSKKSFSYYEKALDKNPENAMVLNNYAYYLALQKKNLDKALRMSKKATEINENEPSFLDTYAYLLYLQGKYKEAKTVYRQALAAGGSNSAVILDHYADTLDKLGERSIAEIYWSQALEKPDCLNKDEIRKKLGK